MDFLLEMDDFELLRGCSGQILGRKLRRWMASKAGRRLSGA